ncbi:MAG: rRNA maturation RNase YbeY [Hyphomicrobiaceae bacterium]
MEDEAWGDEAHLERLCAAAAAASAASPEVARRLPAPAVACVAFSNDAAVRDLNARYRGKDKPTNVLSFAAAPMPDGMADEAHLGDIVLAFETVAGEAATLGLALDHHIQHLVVHGVLHLLGYDHESDADAEAMEDLETAILATLGVADPYQSND